MHGPGLHCELSGRDGQKEMQMHILVFSKYSSFHFGNKGYLGNPNEGDKLDGNKPNLPLSFHVIF